MTSKTPKRWILLLNKVPRGPLEEAEVRALLNEGLVRHNDIAFLVPAPDSDPAEKRASEWKLLWQFPEFDRRLEEEKNRTSDPKASSWAGTGTPHVPVPVHPDRRRQMTADEAEEKAREILPPELLDIAPEELVVHSTSQESFAMGDSVEAVAEQRSFELQMPSQRVMAAVGGIVLVVVLVFTFRPGSSVKSVKAPPVSTGSGEVAIESQPGAAKRAPTARVAPRPTGTIVSPVTAPEARIPASRGRVDEPESIPDQGDFDPAEEDDQLAADDGEESAQPAVKRRSPAKTTRRPRVLSDDRAEQDEEDDRSASSPPNGNDDDRDRPQENED